jgi:hypothetical protein
LWNGDGITKYSRVHATVTNGDGLLLYGDVLFDTDVTLTLYCVSLLSREITAVVAAERQGMDAAALPGAKKTLK